MSSSESTPLVNNAHQRTNSNSYYFLNNPAAEDSSGRNNGINSDLGNEVEGIPPGSATEEFAPRVLGPRKPSMTRQVTGSGRSHASSLGAGGGNVGSRISGFMARLMGRAPEASTRPFGEVGTLLKIRKAPVKIEPKVFFANERTFLAWMHLSVILAGASIAILAFAEENNPFSQLYGVIMLPVAIAFIVYSMFQYTRRASMIRRRHPGPYEDTTGPTVLTVMLILSILAQFALKLYALHASSSR